ncbi:sensor histidine kinase [Leptospira sarikeiensis]|uniref:histidine kinase n=1 Tax=Leptospira sarikeiensis TaxID=2484943 RepID=A0A4R9KHE9_9LEPT|nr:HAMP domain-containing sensor histidine kinase [Leptospira sarikeiensis]TGL65921.1 sensor histidine kinase [Leptospira sarikeiensis]
MRKLFQSFFGLNYRFALRQYRKAKILSSVNFAPVFTRNAYLEILTVLRYVYFVLPVIILPFAAYDLVDAFTGAKDNSFVLFDLLFYFTFILMNVLLNSGRLHRADLGRIKLISRIGVVLLSLTGTCITVVVFPRLPEISLFSAAMFSVAIMFRFPDHTKYFIYIINYSILYGFIYYSGNREPVLIQNPLVTLFLILILDRVSFLTLANTYLKTQRIIRLNERLREEDINKSDMISIAVHDLKSPLSGIMSISTILRKNLKSFSDREKKEILTDIEGSSRKILGHIDDLVGIAASGLENIKINYDVFNINSYIRSTVQNFDYQASLKRIQFHTKFEKEDLRIRSDRKAVARILDNLVSNAVKYSPIGGSIFIDTKIVREDGNFIQIQIGDEGKGFTEEDKKLAFSRFTRLSARPTGNEPSTGVGLYAVHRLAELLHAKINLDSEPGQGAIFTLLFESV